MKGNDGSNYKVVAILRGVHRWVLTKDPITESTPKFKTGDRVKIVQSGWGCHSDLLYQEVIIKDCISYTIGPVTRYGYTIVNQHLYLNNNGFPGTSDTIWEDSFQLIADYSALDIEKIIKQQKVKNMSSTQSQPKARLLTKRATQEIRTIETSLINKEEVFKMLALAEATGLPCLLVGNPGVNSK